MVGYDHDGVKVEFGVRTKIYDTAFKQDFVEEFMRGDKRGTLIGSVRRSRTMTALTMARAGAV